MASPHITPTRPGRLVISLDLELFWGMRDKRSLAEYGPNIRGVREALPRMLDAFDRYGVKATFATVGLLFFDAKEDLLTAIPAELPSYRESHLSPYNGHLETLGADERLDPYHFGASLIRLIQAHPGHEVGCHTFSHYYCLEAGQSEGQFAADLDAARIAAQRFGITLSSFVFPRNQYQENYLQVCREQGITCYRGNERSWLYDARNGDQESLFRRMFRLLDAWVDISGPNCHDVKAAPPDIPMDIPSSRFLRPWNKRTKPLEGLRLRRITRAMDHAAANGQVFHLWWHPHNFGANPKENLDRLRRLLELREELRLEHGFGAFSMADVDHLIRQTCSANGASAGASIREPETLQPTPPAAGSGETKATS